MTKIWRFLDTGKNPGVYNMALDEAILEILEQGKTAPSLRLYQWSPACLSLGRNQGLKTINLGLAQNWALMLSDDQMAEKQFYTGTN